LEPDVVQASAEQVPVEREQRAVGEPLDDPGTIRFRRDRVAVGAHEVRVGGPAEVLRGIEGWIPFHAAKIGDAARAGYHVKSGGAENVWRKHLPPQGGTRHVLVLAPLHMLTVRSRYPLPRRYLYIRPWPRPVTLNSARSENSIRSRPPLAVTAPCPALFDSIGGRAVEPPLRTAPIDFPGRPDRDSTVKTEPDRRRSGGLPFSGVLLEIVERPGARVPHAFPTSAIRSCP